MDGYNFFENLLGCLRNDICLNECFLVNCIISNGKGCLF